MVLTMTDSKEYEFRIKELHKLCEIASRKGTYDCNSYLHGMANGIIFALAIMENKDPEYLDPPDIFLEDYELLDELDKNGIIINRSITNK